MISGGVTGRASDEGVSQVVARMLRCEYLVDPPGIDLAAPRLSWEVRAAQPPGRGLKQSAFQVLVASSRALLAEGQADLWDSGRLMSSESIGIEYAGRALRSRDQCHWTVRLWDQNGTPSGWSDPARWSVGLLELADWKARWISHPPTEPSSRPQWGYCSLTGDTKDSPKWVQIDLGSETEIDAIRLWLAWPTMGGSRLNVRWGEGFPLRFKIEVGNRADMSDAKTVVDRTGEDWPHPDRDPVELRFGSTPARFVRLTVTLHRGSYDPMVLTRFGDDQSGYVPVMTDRKNGERNAWKLMLAEMEVLGAGVNHAQGKAVVALDSCEDPGVAAERIPAGVRPGRETGWSREMLTDGRTEGDPGSAYHHRPVPMFRRSFEVTGAVNRATFYAAALGSYEASINGRRIGDAVISPDPLAQGWQEMDERRLRYQTYDVTDMIAAGQNVVGALLADGFYRMRHYLDHYNNAERFKKHPGPDAGWFLGQLEIEYVDGRRETVGTDHSWQCYSDGPWRRVSMYDGARYDQRKEVPGWDTPAYRPDAGWTAAREKPIDPKIPLSGLAQEPIRVVRVLKSVRRTDPKPGVAIFDFGQNFAGVCRATIDGPAGVVVRFRYSNMLRPDGHLHVGHLCGSWDSADEIVLAGKGPVTFTPKFTYHGGGYLEVSGLDSPEAVKDVEGLAFSTDLRRVSSVESSSPTLNRLCEMIDWTMRSNLLGSPIDTADRDERYPWMGDCYRPQSVAYLYDTAAFDSHLTQLLLDSVNDEGVMNGWIRAVKGYVPAVLNWGDGVVLVPHHAWLNYADRRSLEKAQANTRKYLGFLARANPDWLPRNKVNIIGDWVSARQVMPPNGKSWRPYGGEQFSAPNPLFGQAWWAYTAGLAAEGADAIGDGVAATEFKSMAEHLRRTFAREFVKDDGTVGNGSQSCYAFLLAMGLDRDLPEALRAKIRGRVPESIANYHSRLSTGSVSTRFFLHALSENGYHEEACQLVLDPRFPSPAYFVQCGLRTLPEMFDAYHQELGVNPGRNGTQNGLNHVSLHGLYEWIVENVAGIRPEWTHPGWKHFAIAPQPGGGLTWIRASYDSIRGTIRSAWRIEGTRFLLDVTIPPNTTATVVVPRGFRQTVELDGVRVGDGVLTLPSGAYRIVGSSPANWERSPAKP